MTPKRPQSLIAQLTRVDWHTRALQCTAVLTLVLVVGVVIGVATPGYEGDLEQAKTWARYLVRNGLRDAYRTDIDGAPILLYVFAAVGWLYQAMIDPAWNEQAAQASQVFTLMLKAPMIAAHVAITAVLFALSASANAGSKYGPVVVALAYGLNPATLYDAAHFGQTDPLVGLVVVTCLAACYWRSALLLGIGAAGLLIGKP